MPRLSHSAMIGLHLPGNGEGITVDDLIELLQSIPSQARSNFVTSNGSDVTGLSISQSDQAEKWEFKISIKTAEDLWQ